MARKSLISSKSPSNANLGFEASLAAADKLPDAKQGVVVHARRCFIRLRLVRNA
jgi:hypothetical protein